MSWAPRPLPQASTSWGPVTRPGGWWAFAELPGTHLPSSGENSHRGQLRPWFTRSQPTWPQGEGPHGARTPSWTRHSPRPSLHCSPRTASSRALLSASSSRARDARPRCTTTCRHRETGCSSRLPGGAAREQGLPPGLWGASGPHRPYTARLLLRLAGGTLGGPHGLQNAAVGVGGLDGPLDEAVLVDSLDDAVRGSGEDPRVRVGAPPTSRASACLAALDSRPCTALCACPASSCHPGPRLLPGPCRDTGLSF